MPAIVSTGAAKGIVNAALATHAALTAAHGVSGAIVGTTDTQTLSNKTLTTPTIASFANAQHTHTDAESGGVISGGGGGTPGGNSGEWQYNSSGSFAGDSGVTRPAAGTVQLSAALISPAMRPAANSETALQWQDASAVSFLVGDTTNKRTKFIYPSGTGDGIAVKGNHANTGGYSRCEISGTSAGWTAGKGIVFNNHVQTIEIGATVSFAQPIAVGQFWAAASAGVNAVGDALMMTSASQKIRLTALKYASSPYPDVVLSAPSFSVKTKTGAAWSDGSSGAEYGTQRFKIQDDGKIAIGNITATALLDIDCDIIRLRTAKTPASATAAGNQGDQAWDENYEYRCVATSTWKRAALSTW